MLSWQPCSGSQWLLCVCAAPVGALAWLCRGSSVSFYSGHMPGRLIIYNFLIPGSSQVPQMLLLPLLLNQSRKQREREICQYCFFAGTEIKTVCGILSDRSPCAKSPFCVTHLHKIGICPYVS